MRVRVAVYNVRGFRDGLREVAEVVGHFEPDLLLLNESGPRRALRRFAKAVGMDVAHDPWSPFRRRIKNAVLARPPWRLVEHRLHRFADVRRALYPRGALVAHLGQAGRRLWVLSIHLGLHPLERLHAAEELADLARGLGGAVLLGGDCNEAPDGRAISFLSDRFWDAWVAAAGSEAGRDAASPSGETFPAEDPTSRIDYLFVTEEIQVDRALVPSVLPAARSASDHLPLIVDLTLVEPGEALASTR